MAATIDPYQWVIEAVDEHELPLLRYARRLLGDLDLARDAVQHAFVKLCAESQERLDGRIAPWLFRVCRNRALDHLRRDGRERAVLDGEADDPGFAARPVAASSEADPAMAVEQRELGARLRALLAEVPSPQREAIDLWCEGLTNREIAEVTGRTEGHVRVLIHRGLKSLRAHPSIQSLLADETHPSQPQS